jgi:hypothetical protein
MYMMVVVVMWVLVYVDYFFVMCCLVAHSVAPSAEILPLFLLGSFCILYVAAFSVFSPWGGHCA